MTEIYHGPSNPVTGDKPEKKVDDPYHPKYTDCGPYPNTPGILNSPFSGAYKIRVVDVSTVKGN